MQNEKVIPRHIGFIMDGNGRWAKERNKPRTFGHIKGSDRVEDVVTWSFDAGVECVSLYAFSTENKSRPKEEVDKIMSILEKFLDKFKSTLIKNEIRLKVLGDITILSPKIQELIIKRQEETKNFTKKTLNIALNYGGRQEIVHAVNEIIKNGEKNLTEESFSKYLYTENEPDVDLLVRTSGEQRVSNFMLWQIAYAEMYFTNAYWPDFDKKEFDKALEWFANRNRRFGKI